jgi:hypothetical protein
MCVWWQNSFATLRAHVKRWTVFKIKSKNFKKYTKRFDKNAKI